MVDKITLEQVPNIPVGNLSKLPPEELLSLQEQAAKHLQRAKMLKEWLDNSIALKYRDVASNIRRLDSKDTGTVHFTDGDFKVTSVLTKKVEWNQDRLKDVVTAIKKHGDNPDEYVETSYKISETKYTAWPEHIKNIFKPARVLKTGAETFKIQPLAEGGSNE
ncbi:MAG: hypothetical protein EBS06_04535 [Proteobacteria bacterium]|nr:hypothetical protein [Pseudomonadota bacterium]